ncbi:MAG: SGNH/GDSL hydrolase family protein [Marinobacter sp.]|nr:SGNH/GDSL hydrolase family protein [Marinobacter sp.]
MLNRVSIIPLAPVLLIQGRRVRARTPQLPEAAGARSGTLGEGPLLNLLILGDSAAAGVGVNEQREALSGQLAEQLAQRLTVNWTLQAHTGLKVNDYLPPSDRLPQLQADVVVISLGVNDVTSSISPLRWVRRMVRLADNLNLLYRPQQILMSSIPPMHRFPALPQPLRWYLGQRAMLFNRLLKRHLADIANVSVVDVEFTQSPDMIASDGFHPGAAGYTAWAQALAERIHPPASASARRAVTGD